MKHPKQDTCQDNISKSQRHGTTPFPDQRLVLKFAERYCNWSTPTTFLFTSDIDFVPDYMVEYLLDIIEPLNIRWTFFITHNSPILERLAANPNFELAIHPFNDPSSSQGASYEEILDNLISYCKGRVYGSRFHRLGHAYRDLYPLSRRGIEYEVSGLRLNLPFAVPTWHRDLNMLLISYTWEDGTFEATGLPMRLDSIDLFSPGNKIFSFHPINLWLNGPNPDQRVKFFNQVSDLIGLPEEEARKYQLFGDGSCKVLHSILQYVKGAKIDTMRLCDFNFAYREDVLKIGGLC